MIVTNGLGKKVDIKVPEALKGQLLYGIGSYPTHRYNRKTFQENYDSIFSNKVQPDLLYITKTKTIPFICFSKNSHHLLYVEGTYISRVNVSKDDRYPIYVHYIHNVFMVDYGAWGPSTLHPPFRFFSKKKIYSNRFGDFIKVDGHHDFVGPINAWPILAV